MRRARCSSVGVAGSAVLGKGQPSTAPAIALKQLAFYRLAPVPLTGSRTPFTIGAQQRPAPTDALLGGGATTAARRLLGSGLW